MLSNVRPRLSARCLVELSRACGCCQCQAVIHGLLYYVCVYVCAIDSPLSHPPALARSLIRLVISIDLALPSGVVHLTMTASTCSNLVLRLLTFLTFIFTIHSSSSRGNSRSFILFIQSLIYVVACLCVYVRMRAQTGACRRNHVRHPLCQSAHPPPSPSTPINKSLPVTTSSSAKITLSSMYS